MCTCVVSDCSTQCGAFSVCNGTLTFPAVYTCSCIPGYNGSPCGATLPPLSFLCFLFPSFPRSRLSLPYLQHTQVSTTVLSTMEAVASMPHAPMCVIRLCRVHASRATPTHPPPPPVWQSTTAKQTTEAVALTPRARTRVLAQAHVHATQVMSPPQATALHAQVRLLFDSGGGWVVLLICRCHSQIWMPVRRCRVAATARALTCLHPPSIAHVPATPITPATPTWDVQVCSLIWFAYCTPHIRASVQESTSVW